MQYTATTNGYRNFQILDDMGTTIGRLDYPSFFSSAGNIIINDREVYNIKVSGFWGTVRQLLRNGTPFAELKANLRGGVEIYFETGKTLHFKRKNLWNNEFILADGSEHLLAEMRGEFKWRKFSFDYHIDVYNNMLDREINSLIPFLVTYCAMYVKRRTAAAG